MLSTCVLDGVVAFGLPVWLVPAVRSIPQSWGGCLAVLGGGRQIHIEGI